MALALPFEESFFMADINSHLEIGVTTGPIRGS
jgi:hypothetical protein